MGAFLKSIWAVLSFLLLVITYVYWLMPPKDIEYFDEFIAVLPFILGCIYPFSITHFTHIPVRHLNALGGMYVFIIMGIAFFISQITTSYDEEELCLILTPLFILEFASVYWLISTYMVKQNKKARAAKAQEHHHEHE